MALPETAGVFVRAHCPHARLFEDEYKRCFPHCCPHHVDRSYCGSALEVLLRFGPDEGVAEDNREPFDVANVFVFARFEPVDAATPAPGTHSLSYLRSVSQSEANPEGSWIEGVRQTAADRQQHSQQLHGRQTAPSRPATRSSEHPESATFGLNSQAYAKWYYHWESGANKVQRATKHALKAYVFYRTHATSSQQGDVVHPEAPRDGALELLCVVTSPPFTVVSYRRAPLEASTAFAGSPGAVGVGGFDASPMPHYATDAAQPVDSRLRRLVQHQISRAFQEYDQQQQRRSSDDGGAFVPFFGGQQEQHEDQRGGAEPDQLDRYRRLQEREGLRFRLLTPEDAARSGPSLHSQIQAREPRLVFDSTRRPQTQHWRGTDRAHDEEFVEDYEDYDVQDDAVPQPRTSQRWAEQSASPYEGKSAGPVGMPPSSTDPARGAERAASVALLRYKQQKRQLDSHERELHALTDLSIVHFFVSRVAACHAGSLANLEAVFTIAISQHWRANGGSAQLARVLLTFATGAGHAATASAVDGADPKSEEVMLVLAEVCVWAFSPGNVTMIQRLLTACQPLLLDRLKAGGSGSDGDGDGDGKELRTAFLECVSRCWSALNGFLQSPRATRSAIRSVQQLSDAVLGVVYSNLAFEDLRAGLRRMLQRPAVVLEDSKENVSADPDAYGSATARCNLAGWQGFVAQVREGYLRGQYSGRGLPWSPVQGANSRPSKWSADWALQPNTVSTTSDTQWRPSRGAQASDTANFTQAGTASPRADVLSMWTSCLALSQLLHLKLAVAGDPVHTLYVQSEPSVLSPDNAWMRLICDGRVRLAPVAPNGLTSLMGGASCGFGGDYVAYHLDESSGIGDGRGRSPQGPSDSSDHSSLGVEFYWWPVAKTQGTQKPLVAFRSVVTLKVAASGAFMDGHLDLERGVIERNAVAAAQSSEMELWAPSERVQSVAAWSPWLSIEGVYARK